MHVTAFTPAFSPGKFILHIKLFREYHKKHIWCFPKPASVPDMTRHGHLSASVIVHVPVSTSWRTDGRLYGAGQALRPFWQTWRPPPLPPPPWPPERVLTEILHPDKDGYWSNPAPVLSHPSPPPPPPTSGRGGRRVSRTITRCRTARGCGARNVRVTQSPARPPARGPPARRLGPTHQRLGRLADLMKRTLTV